MNPGSFRTSRICGRHSSDGSGLTTDNLVQVLECQLGLVEVRRPARQHGVADEHLVLSGAAASLRSLRRRGGRRVEQQSPSLWLTSSMSLLLLEDRDAFVDLRSIAVRSSPGGARRRGADARSLPIVRPRSNSARASVFRPTIAYASPRYMAHARIKRLRGAGAFVHLDRVLRPAGREQDPALGYRRIEPGICGRACPSCEACQRAHRPRAICHCPQGRSRRSIAAPLNPVRAHGARSSASGARRLHSTALSGTMLAPLA